MHLLHELSLQVYQLDGTSLASVSSVESGSGFKCSSFGASSVSDPKLAVGSFDGKLQLWDLENPSAPVWDAQAHASIVNGIDGFGGQVGHQQEWTRLRSRSTVAYSAATSTMPGSILAALE